MSYERAWVIGVFGRVMVKRAERDENVIGQRAARGAKLGLHALVSFGCEPLQRRCVLPNTDSSSLQKVRHENRFEQ